MTKSKSAAKLSAFEGGDVIAAEMKLTKTGDGLSKHLAMEPLALHVGDDVYMVFRATVSQVGFKASKDAPGHFIRVHTTEAAESTIVDRDAVLAILESHRAKVAEFTGQPQLDGLAAELGADAAPADGDEDWEPAVPPRPLRDGEAEPDPS